MHSTTEVGDHKISGKEYSNISSVEWVNSDGMSKQDNFFNTFCHQLWVFFTEMLSNCTMKVCYCQENPKEFVTQQTSI